MTGNKAYLVEYHDFNGGPVAFGGKGPTWLFDLDYLTDSMNYQPVTTENKATKTTAEHVQEYFVLLLWSSYTSTVKSSEAKNGDEKPIGDIAETLRKTFPKSIEDLLLQAGAARANSMNNVNTASTPVNTASKPVNTASTPVNTASISRNIPSLADIYEVLNDEIFTSASCDDEGVVVDFTNLRSTVNVSPIPQSRIHSILPATQILIDPTSAVQTRSKVNKSSGAHAFIEPKKISQALKDESWVDAMQEELLQFKTQQVWILVDLPFRKKVIVTKWLYRNKKDERGRIEAIKIFLAFASYMGFIVYQMDVKSAFLYGKINEEVYVSQPSGFIDPKFPNKVYKVVKALRGLIDKTLFIKKDKKDIKLVQAYVDDIIFGSTKKSWCDEFEALMKSRFQMSSMGELTLFLGLQVKQRENRIFISQDKYVAEILKKFDFMSVKTASTLIKRKKPLVKDAGAADVDVHLYRSMIGSLIYLTASRHDIMYAVCGCSRFQVTPKSSHLQAVKRIFKYLKGQPKLGLWYPRELVFDLEAYSDGDYAGENLDRKSTTGEAEYIAAASCCRQILWIQNQMLDWRSTDKFKVLDVKAEGVSAAGETLNAATLTISIVCIQPVLVLLKLI
nr:hypothetical protein [Tanacetum cinerariifolium]